MARTLEYRTGFNAPPKSPYDARAGERMRYQIRGVGADATARGQRFRNSKSVLDNRDKRKKVSDQLSHLPTLPPRDQRKYIFDKNSDLFAPERYYHDLEHPEYIVHEKRSLKGRTRVFYAMSVPTEAEKAAGVQPRPYVAKIIQTRNFARITRSSKEIERSFDQTGKEIEKTKKRSNGRHFQKFNRVGNQLVRTEFRTNRLRDGVLWGQHREELGSVDMHGKRRFEITRGSGRRGETYEFDEKTGLMKQTGHVGWTSSIAEVKSEDGRLKTTSIKRLGRADRTSQSHLDPKTGEITSEETLAKRGLTGSLTVTLDDNDGSVKAIRQRGKLGRLTKITYLPETKNGVIQKRVEKKRWLWLDSTKTVDLTKAEKLLQEARRTAMRDNPRRPGPSAWNPVPGIPGTSGAGTQPFPNPPLPHQPANGWTANGKGPSGILPGPPLPGQPINFSMPSPYGSTSPASQTGAVPGQPANGLPANGSGPTGILPGPPLPGPQVNPNFGTNNPFNAIPVPSQTGAAFGSIPRPLPSGNLRQGSGLPAPVPSPSAPRPWNGNSTSGYSSSGSPPKPTMPNVNKPDWQKNTGLPRQGIETGLDFGGEGPAKRSGTAAVPRIPTEAQQYLGMHSAPASSSQRDGRPAPGATPPRRTYADLVARVKALSGANGGEERSSSGPSRSSGPAITEPETMEQILAVATASRKAPSNPRDFADRQARSRSDGGGRP
ncbi:MULTISPECIES: hypothetical protein [unclassified Neorhizobium]|uniref:hypothetical protein n=1 Tax=unclassified Neorhizobium TaxID=2629175 RepID=UPI001FF53CA7|nr:MULTISPECIES: hypothetical protein [unclassified Neorhizobium]MCJ9672012.1 hypothetical protein [Neorhizobium sp. SHOUNA12B]MCJ9747946.1 hypothetical protein [Neorhizobium sp. SHOUNA12A]